MRIDRKARLFASVLLVTTIAAAQTGKAPAGQTLNITSLSATSDVLLNGSALWDQVAIELRLGDPLGWSAVAQVHQCTENLLCHVGQSRLQLDGLFILRDLPAERIIVGKRRGLGPAVRLPRNPRRRHELAVGHETPGCHAHDFAGM